MTIGQNLESLRVQLGSVHRELHQLVLLAPLAPLPAADSGKYDQYATKLTVLEHRLRAMQSGFARMSRQGPGFRGPSEDPYQAKQRDASFRAQVQSVEAILKLCFDELAALFGPQNKLLARVKGISDLARKADEVMKAVRQDAKFTSTVTSTATAFRAPRQEDSVELSASTFVTLAIVVVIGIKRALAKK